MQKKNFFTFIPTKKTWLLASTVLISTGIGDMLKKSHTVSADDAATTIVQHIEKGGEQFAGVDSKDNPQEKDVITEKSEVRHESSDERVSSAIDHESVSDNGYKEPQVVTSEKQEKAVEKLPVDQNSLVGDESKFVQLQDGKEPLAKSDLIVNERNKRELRKVAQSIVGLVSEQLSQQPVNEQSKAQSNETDNEPLIPLYEATKTSSYEELVDKLGGFLPNFSHPGDGTLDANQEHVEKPGEMIFGVPDYAWFGYGSQQNDYSNVSYMRLVTDQSFVRRVADRLLSLVGTPYKGTKTSYMPENKTLAYSGGFPFYAVVQSTNDSLLSPSFYFGQLKRTLQTVTNILTLGAVDNELNHDYESGQYGVYLRMAVPDGVDPNTFVKSLNLNKSKFGAQMDFNVNLSIDEVLNRIPGVRAMISSSVGLPISGYTGSIVDYMLSSVIAQVNEKHGTNLKVRGVDSPFYPITLYPKDIKTNVKEDPHGIYLLVRGVELKDFDSKYLQAKILLTKFFMNALSWGGNLVGGAYGYLNFDMKHYQGNLSSEEMAATYGKKQAESASLKGFADDSPFKILTRGQLPPQPDGRLRFALNPIDGNAMLSRQSKHYQHGDLGRDIAINRNKIHDNQVESDHIVTWRAYISPFDQESQYNTKSITSSVAEFSEVPGVETVLPGRDLDHRVIVLKPGEKFYLNRNRFDRVIDFFNGQVILDKAGVHANNTVQSVRIVKSLDPEGKHSKKEDFEIYDRPFTVFYTGEMLLKNGERIALRPTKIKVIQQSTRSDVELVSRRIKAFDQLKEQMLFSEKVLDYVRPKIADYQLVNYLKQLHEQLFDANHAIESAQSKEEILRITEAANQAMMATEEKAVENRDLDQAVKQAARLQGQERLQQAAYTVRLDIENSRLLSADQREKLNKSLETVSNQEISTLASFDKRDTRVKRSITSLRDFLTKIRRKADAGVKAISNVYISTEVRDQAVQALVNLADERKKEFAAIDFVDQLSLKRQTSLINANVSIYERHIRKANSNDVIETAKEKGLAAIKNVARPTRIAGYDNATADERAAALKVLRLAVKDKQQAFAAILHVDDESLVQQVAELEKHLASGEEEVKTVKTKGELATALKHALALLETVAEPELQLAYQAVDELSRQNAIDAIQAAGKVKQAEMRKLKYVDAHSLVEQTLSLQEIIKDALAAINQAQNKAVLRDALTNGLATIDSLSDPMLDDSYREPTVHDQLEAEKAIKTAVLDKQKEFSQLIGVDPTSLTHSLTELTNLLNQSLDELKTAKTASELDESYRRALQNINKIDQPVLVEGKQPATVVEHQEAKDSLRKHALQRKEEFGKLEHVDPESLKQQGQIIDRLVDKKTALMDKSVTKDELASVLRESLAMIDSVSNPKLVKEYRTITGEDRDNARVELETISQQRKIAMAGIAHVDANSLTEQQGLLDQVLAEQLNKLANAKIQKELQQLLQEGIQAISQIANPSIEDAYQIADEAQKKAAVDQLNAAVSAKKALFASIPHVDMDSLKKQEAFLDVLLEEAKQAVDSVQENGAVNRAVGNALASIEKVTKPNLMSSYRPASSLMKELAKQALNAEKRAQEAQFRGILHVDQDALNQQIQQLENCLSDAIKLVEQAKDRGSVKQAVQNGLAQIEAVQAPNVLFEYQPITEKDRQEAVEVIERAQKHQAKDFDHVMHADPNSLKAQQELLDKVSDQAKHDVENAKTQGELQELLKKVLKNLAAIPNPEVMTEYQPVSPGSKEKANRQLSDAVDEKIDFFKNIDGVDNESLKKQVGILHELLEKAQKSIETAPNNGDLAKVLQDGLTAIQKVDMPNILEEKKQPTVSDKASALNQIVRAINKLKAIFETIPHVDTNSLQQQEDVLNAILQKAKEVVERAETKGELAKNLQNSFEEVNKVSQPSLEDAYQPADQPEKNRAIAVIYQLVDQKKRNFESLAHVEENSLKDALKQLSKMEEDAVNAIQEAQTRGGVNQALSSGLKAIQAIAKPTISVFYQPANQEDRKQAIESIRSAGQQMNDQFNQIAFVDSKSLKLAQSQVKMLVDQGLEKVALAENKGMIHQVVTDSIDRITSVDMPELDVDHAAVDPVQRGIYQLLLKKTAEQRQSIFNGMEHTMQSSLKQQTVLIQKTLKNSLEKLNSAQTGSELTAGYLEGQKKIQAIAEPMLQVAYQIPTAADFKKAQETLEQEGIKRVQIFSQIKDVDPDSLSQLTGQVNQIVSEQSHLLEAAKTKMALNQLRQQAVSLIRHVPLPAVQQAKQKPTKQEINSARKALKEAVKDRKADFEQKVHVDPIDLVVAEKRLDDVYQQALMSLTLAKTKEALSAALTTAVMSIHEAAEPNVGADYQPLSTEAKKIAVQGLQTLLKNKEAIFAGMQGVDVQSLNKQQNLLERAGKHSVQNINALTNKGELIPAVAVSREEINSIDQPDLLRIYQVPDSDDVQAARGQLFTLAEGRKQQFVSLAHADATSVQEQTNRIDQIVNDFTTQFDNAQSIDRLNQLLLDGQHIINLVEAPTLDVDYVDVTPADIALAKKVIELAVSKRTEEMMAMKDADELSRDQRIRQLQELVVNYEPALALARTKGELNRTTNILESLLLTMPDPDRRVEERKGSNPIVPIVDPMHRQMEEEQIDEKNVLPVQPGVVDHSQTIETAAMNESPELMIEGEENSDPSLLDPAHVVNEMVHHDDQDEKLPDTAKVSNQGRMGAIGLSLVAVFTLFKRSSRENK